MYMAVYAYESDLKCAAACLMQANTRKNVFLLIWSIFLFFLFSICESIRSIVQQIAFMFSCLFACLLVLSLIRGVSGLGQAGKFVAFPCNKLKSI